MLLNELNESQRQAVLYNDGPQLVIAGAGSGKTRVLTYKIAHLLQSGMNPWNILALTFTNKAANEMKQRIGNLIGQDVARQLNMGTFHSIFSRILRVEGERIGFNSNFTIYDEADSRSLIKTLIKEMQLDEKKYKPANIHSKISMAKNHLISASQYAQDNEALTNDRNNRIPDLYKIYTAYSQRCQKANAMDFDDLLVLTYNLFRDNKDIREKYAQRFQYILVDEYQDTNYVQQCIVFQLARENERVCAVGDDAQSIYSFRGANIDNILDFQKVYEKSKIFKLERNYRSTQNIVQAANCLIKHNERQIPKDVYSENDEGEKIALKPAYSDKEEAAIVCKDIKRIKRQENCEYSDFAILYRTNAQSRSFEEEMRKLSIPYRIFGGMSFYQRKEIKDIIAYFRIVANPDDEEAIKRIINYPSRGIGNTTIQKIAAAAQKFEGSFWQIISLPTKYQLDINKGTISKLDSFREMICDFMSKLTNTDAYTLGKEIIQKSGISADIFSSSDPESITRQENLEEFMSALQDFVEERREEDRERETSLTDFLQEVSLISDLDSDDEETSKVSLMTIHSAKGLEFPTVFVVGLEENIFPSPMSCNSLRELEEERRLLYVAITRAEKHCILTCAKNRYRYGKMEFDTPSRFLKDIDKNLMDIQGSLDSYKEERTCGNQYRHNTYESNKPYTGSHNLGPEYMEYNGKYQNSRPIASQFRADTKPKITKARHSEEAIVPFSESFKRQLANSGANLTKISAAITNGGRVSTSSEKQLSEGNMIEHQRFGIGKVIKVEGVGENTKATVEFKNAGIKQLLLKFARFNIIS